MLGWLMNLGLFDPPATPPTADPYRVAAGQLRLDGAAVGELASRVATAGQYFNTGQTVGQIDGRCG